MYAVIIQTSYISILFIIIDSPSIQILSANYKQADTGCTKPMICSIIHQAVLNIKHHQTNSI